MVGNCTAGDQDHWGLDLDFVRVIVAVVQRRVSSPLGLEQKETKGTKLVGSADGDVLTNEMKRYEYVISGARRAGGLGLGVRLSRYDERTRTGRTVQRSARHRWRSLQALLAMWACETDVGCFDGIGIGTRW